MPSGKSVSCSISAAPAVKEPKGLRCLDPKKFKGGKFPALLMNFKQYPKETRILPNCINPSSYVSGS